MKKPSSRPATAPGGRKAVSKKAASKKSAAKKSIDKPKRPREKVLKEPPHALVVSDDDRAGLDCVAREEAKARAASRATRRRTAVDRVEDPAKIDTGDPEGSLVHRVSNAIERELSRIEIIVGGSHVPPVLRTEAESRARVLASLARTLKEVMRLREQERAETNNADDDAIPRNIDELRSELARRLAILVGEATSLHPDAAE